MGPSGQRTRRRRSSLGRGRASSLARSDREHDHRAVGCCRPRREQRPSVRKQGHGLITARLQRERDVASRPERERTLETQRGFGTTGQSTLSPLRELLAEVHDTWGGGPQEGAVPAAGHAETDHVGFAPGSLGGRARRGVGTVPRGACALAHALCHGTPQGSAALHRRGRRQGRRATDLRPVGLLRQGRREPEPDDPGDTTHTTSESSPPATRDPPRRSPGKGASESERFTWKPTSQKPTRRTPSTSRHSSGRRNVRVLLRPHALRTF